MKSNAQKLLNKYLSDNIKLSSLSPIQKSEDQKHIKLDFNKLCLALSELNNPKTKQDFELDEERLIIQTLIEKIASGALHPKSSQFKQICRILKSSKETKSEKEILGNIEMNTGHIPTPAGNTKKEKANEISQRMDNVYFMNELSPPQVLQVKPQTSTQHSPNPMQQVYYNPYNGFIPVDNSFSFTLNGRPNYNNNNLSLAWLCQLPYLLTTNNQAVDSQLLDLLLNDRYKRMCYNNVYNNNPI